jgi:hypothetical protein
MQGSLKHKSFLRLCLLIQKEKNKAIERHRSRCSRMSAISNKSKLVLFLMVVISLAFLLTSFLTAAMTNDMSFSRNSQAQSGLASPAGSAQPAQTDLYKGNCFVVRTVDGKVLGECFRS